MMFKQTQRKQPPQTRKRIRSNVDAAKVHKQNGQLDLAHDCLKEALSDAQVFYGDDAHPEVVQIRELMADYLSKDAQYYPEALAMYTSLLQLTEAGTKAYEKLQRKELETMNLVKDTCANRKRNLAKKRVYDMERGLEEMENGNYGAARMYLVSALGASKIRYGVNHESVVTIRAHLADLCVRQKHYEEACDIYRSILLTLERTLGCESERYQAVLGRLKEVSEHCSSGQVQSEDKLLVAQSEDQLRVPSSPPIMPINETTENVPDLDAKAQSTLSNAKSTPLKLDSNSAYLAQIDSKIASGVSHILEKKEFEGSQKFSKYAPMKDEESIFSNPFLLPISELTDEFSYVATTFRTKNSYGTQKSDTKKRSQSKDNDLDGTVSSKMSDVTPKSAEDNSAYSALIDLKIDIGLSHFRKKEFEESEKCFTYALNALQKLYGDENMQVAIVQEYLGDIAIKMGKDMKGDDLYACASMIIAEILGKDVTDISKYRPNDTESQRNKVAS
eukprot:CAMPEP_0196812888 /NCGR_PEP_ID=MMETSP1362-20130617/32052_1 /TAXON_ID=163516 /ORGANISM="Leptocylindrus danicus, Strain CCMP1856" /LENGTH=502 /DNA_ID=CAMNT_0042188831 /DNA_START=108 /DNA_END=1617 /DNA_ORIENTATION=-